MSEIATCDATIFIGIGWLICGQPPVAVHDYACVHEHVLRRGTCAEHAPVPDAVGCAQCFQLGHDCPVTFQLVEVLDA